MKNYKKITSSTGSVVPTKTPAGIKKLVKNNKFKEGLFTCFCPSGNIHLWEVKSVGSHITKGRTVKKVRQGKGSTVVNYSLVFKGVAENVN